MTIVVTPSTTSGSYTYTSLKSSIAQWLHRTDLDSIIPDLIGIAEQRMNSDINARDMETAVTLYTVADSKTITAPDDIIESVRMTLQTSPNRLLNYLAPEPLVTQFANQASGEPQAYTVYGSQFEFGPVPSSVYEIEYVYRQKIPPLSTENPSNWLLAKWPYVYLYGALLASAPYLGQDQRVVVWQKEYQEMVDNINQIDWYTGTSMRVRAV